MAENELTSNRQTQLKKKDIAKIFGLNDSSFKGVLAWIQKHWAIVSVRDREKFCVKVNKMASFQTKLRA